MRTGRQDPQPTHTAPDEAGTMSIESLSLPELLPLEEALPAHLHWSTLNGELLDYVAQNPEWLERDTFRWLHDQHWLRKLNLQCWPLFMDDSRRREVEA